MERAEGLSRGYATWLLYGVFACMAFLLNGLGAVLAPLQVELHVSRGQVAFYPSLFAAGLVLVGLGGGPLVSRLIAAWPQAPDPAAARAALASGLAIGIAPFVLAQLSDAIGLRAAFLIVPVLLLVLAVRAGRVYASLPR